MKLAFGIAALERHRIDHMGPMGGVEDGVWSEDADSRPSDVNAKPIRDKRGRGASGFLFFPAISETSMINLEKKRLPIILRGMDSKVQCSL